MTLRKMDHIQCLRNFLVMKEPLTNLFSSSMLTKLVICFLFLVLAGLCWLFSLVEVTFGFMFFQKVKSLKRKLPSAGRRNVRQKQSTDFPTFPPPQPRLPARLLCGGLHRLPLHPPVPHLPRPLHGLHQEGQGLHGGQHRISAPDRGRGALRAQ